MADFGHTASAIIVAAGRGVRMQTPLAKQFIQIGHRPVIVHTLEAFAAHPWISEIRLVVPEPDMVFCRREILPQVKTEKTIGITAGGPRRQDSVYRGLTALGPAAAPLVVIHDGVRPFVRSEIISACIEGAGKHGACIAGIPASDTLKRVTAGNFIAETVSRKNVWLAQTPQAFALNLIQKAFEQAAADGFEGTDDASLVERMGLPVYMIEGSRHNIKITTPADLKTAACILENQLTAEVRHEQ